MFLDRSLHDRLERRTQRPTIPQRIDCTIRQSSVCDNRSRLDKTGSVVTSSGTNGLNGGFIQNHIDSMHHKPVEQLTASQPGAHVSQRGPAQ